MAFGSGNPYNIGKRMRRDKRRTCWMRIHGKSLAEKCGKIRK
jgi:hypothetical protein